MFKYITLRGLPAQLLFLTFCIYTSLIISLQFIKGLSQTNEEECLALLQIAGKFNLSTNCNCPNHDTIDARFWVLCNGSCTTAGARTPPRPFARCAASLSGHLVHELHLSQLGLRGNLSWVESFKHLKLLDVSLNNLSGNIPSSLWRLDELAHANLSFNSFNGSINFPHLNASSPHIQTLDLSHNQLVGHFPGNLCKSLPKLTHLSISSNHLTGYVNLSLCKGLESLDASFNMLQGSLFDGLDVGNTLKSIDLKKNYLLDGSIPSLSNFSQLIYFDVSFNNFSGMFVFQDHELPKNLSSINVSHNNLQVAINSNTVLSLGLSSFWPNKACAGCFPVTMSPSESPSFSTPAPYQKRVHAIPKHTRLDIIIGITAGSVTAILIVAFASYYMFVHKPKRKLAWPPQHKRLPLPALKNTPESGGGPFLFESQSGSWIAEIKDPSNVPIVIFQKPLLNLTFADLIHVTKSFHREYEVGDGTCLGYACVLPGVLADNAKVVIKVVEDGRRSLSNDAACTAFTAMGKLQHDNLVPLLGYCIAGEEKLLIYKHMEGGSLEDVLHAVPEGAPLLQSSDAAMAEDWCNMESWPVEDDKQSACVIDCSSKPCTVEWETRYNIALGVARALAYLHNGCHVPIVHGAVSSSCILMDVAAKEAKLANYGGAWGLPRKLAQGYVAPECRQTTQTAASHLPSALKCQESVKVLPTYSSKCDVYAMGVLLLELATGRPAVGKYDGASTTTTLVAWVRALMKGKRAAQQLERAVVLDPKLISSAAQLVEMTKVGYLCTADSPSKRPSMQQVVGLLKDLAGK